MFVVDDVGYFWGCSYLFVAVIYGKVGIESLEWTLVHVLNIGYL